GRGAGGGGAAVDKGALSVGMKGLQVRVARAVNKILGRKGRLFGDRYHAHVLETPREAQRALSYVLLNGRKHLAQAGFHFASDLVDWFSSAIHFRGWRTPVRLVAPHP